MARVFDEMWRERRGPLHGARLWLSATWDVARSARRSWAAVGRSRRLGTPPSHTPGDGRPTFALGDALHDVRYALRQLVHHPCYTAAYVATLGLGIGAATVMFSVLDAVVLKPLPVRAPEQLAMVWTAGQSEPSQGRPDFLTFEAWRAQRAAFEDVAAFDPVSVTLRGADGAERIGVVRVTANLFPLLGIEPLLGRLFTSEEAEQRQRVALISQAFWQSRFAGAPDALGASIELDGHTSRIVGVLPAAWPFADRESVSVFEPHTMFPGWESTGNEGSWFVIGRLRPGVTVEETEAEMDALALDGRRPAAEGTRGVSIVPLSRHVLGPRPRLALWMLAGAVFCVFLIACANVVGLLLARGVGRAREFAVRATLGASPGRIVRQLLAETVTLALLSGALGTWLAVGGIRLIRAFGPGDVARLNEASLDVGALAWALTVSMLTGIAVGLAPAGTMMRGDLHLSGGAGVGGTSAGVATRRVRRGLVVAQFALAIVLLTGAALLVRSWVSLTRVDPGFVPGRVLSINVSTSAFVEDAQRKAYYERVLEQVESLPGVQSAGLIGDLLTDGDVELIVNREGPEATSTRVRLRVDEVSDHLFTTLRTPLVQGRFFSAADGPDAPPTAIVNEAMSRRLWPGGDPVGQRFKLGRPDGEAPWMTVVGVVADMRRQGLEREPIPQVFVPIAQQPSGNEILLVRTATDQPLEMAAAVQAALRGVDARVPLYFVTTLEDELSADLTPRGFQTSLLIGFAVVALLMAAIGIYGLVHYSVATRTQEIGVRMAVGATATDILRITLWEGLRLSTAGLLLGLAGALAVGLAGSSLLFGVTAADPLTFATVSALLLTVAAAASFLPARRAMRVEPTVALRRD